MIATLIFLLSLADLGSFAAVASSGWLFRGFFAFMASFLLLGLKKSSFSGLPRTPHTASMNC